MKQDYLQKMLLSAATLVLIPSLSFSSPQLIYGIDNAKLFASNNSGPFYIALGTFNIRDNAYDAYNRLKSRGVAIKVTNKKDYYVIQAGPFSSSNKVRDAAYKLDGENSQKSVIKPPKRNRQQTNQVKMPATITTQSEESTWENTPAPTYTYAKDKTGVGPTEGHWYFSAQVGLNSPSINKNMTVNNESGFIAPFNVDSLTTADKNQALAGVAAGRRWERDAGLIPSYLLAFQYQHIFDTDITGTVTQYSLPGFTNYRYSWKYSSNIVSILGKLNIARFYMAMPYISGAVGVASNRTQTYSEKLIEEIPARVSPGFTSKSSNNFAYTLGVGSDFKVNRSLVLAIGYEYQDLGKIVSGYGVDTWSAQNLRLGSYKSHNLIFNISYLIT